MLNYNAPSWSYSLQMAVKVLVIKLPLGQEKMISVLTVVTMYCGITANVLLTRACPSSLPLQMYTHHCGAGLHYHVLMDVCLIHFQLPLVSPLTTLKLISYLGLRFPFFKPVFNLFRFCSVACNQAISRTIVYNKPWMSINE